MAQKSTQKKHPEFDGYEKVGHFFWSHGQRGISIPLPNPVTAGLLMQKNYPYKAKHAAAGQWFVDFRNLCLTYLFFILFFTKEKQISFAFVNHKLFLCTFYFFCFLKEQNIFATDPQIDFEPLFICEMGVGDHVTIVWFLGITLLGHIEYLRLLGYTEFLDSMGHSCLVLWAWNITNSLCMAML